MSQKKVEQYKEYKKNKAKILKREKLMRKLELGIIAVICALFAVWFAISIYQNVTKVDTSNEVQETVVATAVDMNGYADYINELQSSFS